MVKRGEVWLCTLDPTVGSEIQKTRPCVVVSPDELNARLRTVIVAPMTTGSRPAPFRVATRFQEKDGFILTEQLRSVDRGRLISRRDTLKANTLTTLLRTIATMFAETK